MPSAGGGAGWALAVAAFERFGELDKARQMMQEVGGEEMGNWFPAERCFNWENVTLAELALETAKGPIDRRIVEEASGAAST